MIFKRRTPKSWARWAWHLIWPQGGWGRAFNYVSHRVRRLPDSPRRISRGIFVGVFTTFTPFYGIHFVIAAVFARLFNGNIIAALMGTFFGNPLTYVPIGIICLKTGHFILGTEFQDDMNIGQRFAGAGRDLRDNFMAAFTKAEADWTRLAGFHDEIFIPYLVGGLVPGMISAVICYYLSLPLITAYQNRRRGRIKAKLAELRAKQNMKLAEKAKDQIGREEV